MNRLNSIENIRASLSAGQCSIGSWIQIPHPSIAEIMGNAGYDWVAVDMEHGSISAHQLPDLFRALELGNTLPLARLAQGNQKDCKQALDAGAGGVIIPMVESASQLKEIRANCCWPPAGQRGVAFARANLYGRNFKDYNKEAQKPLLVAMIEHHKAIDQLDKILIVEGLDAILIGPYDLSASMGLTSEFSHPDFIHNIDRIKVLCKEYKTPVGIHVVDPSIEQLKMRIEQGYQFLAYSMDSVMLRTSAQYEEN